MKIHQCPYMFFDKKGRSFCAKVAVRNRRSHRDFMFTKKAEEDDPDLYCSRCHQLIESTGMVSMSLYEGEEVYGEWRFHPNCVGMEDWFEED